MKKISTILVILIGVGVVYSGVLLLAKNASYKDGLERKLPIHGTYVLADGIYPAYRQDILMHSAQQQEERWQ